nr:RNA polymerase subunit sigma-24 [Aerococcus urinae]
MDMQRQHASAAGTAEAIFARHRPRIFAVAYRLTGTVSDAEDVVQETWLRWTRTDPSDIHSPEAWLVTTAGRLGIDHLRRVRARRESYVGPWLPEPIVEIAGRMPEPTPEDRLSLADDVSIALLHVLERLAPEERAAFLLHEAFDYGYGELAALLGKSEAACRQIVSRARRRVSDDRPRFDASAGEHRRLANAFSRALATENPGALIACLRDDAVLYSDGGGKAAAALNPIYSADRIARFFVGISKKAAIEIAPESVIVNGKPGFVLLTEGHVHSVACLDIDENGRIATIFVMRNPDKLARAAAALGRPLLML